jgi:hypothetical protein
MTPPPGDSCNNAICRDLSHPKIPEIGYVDIAAAVHGYVKRLPQHGLGGRSPVAYAGRDGSAATGDGRDGPFGIHLSYSVVDLIGDIEVADGIERDSIREGEFRARGWSPVAGISPH